MDELRKHYYSPEELEAQKKAITAQYGDIESEVT